MVHQSSCRANWTLHSVLVRCTSSAQAPSSHEVLFTRATSRKLLCLGPRSPRCSLLLYHVETEEHSSPCPLNCNLLARPRASMEGRNRSDRRCIRASMSK